MVWLHFKPPSPLPQSHTETNNKLPINKHAATKEAACYPHPRQPWSSVCSQFITSLGHNHKEDVEKDRSKCIYASDGVGNEQICTVALSSITMGGEICICFFPVNPLSLSTIIILKCMRLHCSQLVRMLCPIMPPIGGHIGGQVAAVLAVQVQPLHVLALNVAAHVRGVLAGVAADGALPATHHAGHLALHRLPH